MAAAATATAFSAAPYSATATPTPSTRLSPSTLVSSVFFLKNPSKPLHVTHAKNPLSDVISTGKNSGSDDVEFSDDKPREECGVVGIYGDPEASRLSYLALHALQHRGQEGAGIVAVNDGVLQSVTGMGLVSEVFNQSKLDKLPGDIAIGHVRYSTAGSSMLKNVQPFVAGYKFGSVAVAHNGNLVNYQSLRAELEESGSIFNTSSDTEVVLHLIAISKARPFFLRIVEACERLEGAYSFVFLTQDKLVAVRDPYGFRPLVMGRRSNGAVVFASETCALDLIEATYEREVYPGEVLVVDRDGVQSLCLMPHPEPKSCIFEHIYFSLPSSTVFGRSVYESRHKFGEILATESPVDCDVVIAVPDSGVVAALGYAAKAGVAFQQGLIRSHYVGRTFIEPSQRIRDFGVKLKLSPVRAVLEGKRVVVVDDSIVRGTTSSKIVRLLKEAGAKEVHMRIASPPIIASCFYGVDTPCSEELISNRMNMEQIRQYIGSDSLAFLPLDRLKKLLGDDSGNYCYACFSGNYPVHPHGKVVVDLPTSNGGNCSVPVVHLNSDILETESLNLLVGGKYVDTILTSLPVLSEEEQKAISATPAHPAGLYALYASCLAGNLVEQLWNFAWPVAIALIHPSLLPVAVMGFFAKLAVIAGGPLVGKLMDKFPRVPAYNCLTIVQAAAQLLSVGMIIQAHSINKTTVSSVLVQPWFSVLLIAMSVERLSGLALGVAMERDWVVLLAGTNRPIALAQANAILSRIDLLCEIAGASLFGIFLSKYEPVTCLKLAASLMIWSLPVLVFLTYLTNKLSAGVLDRAKCAQTCCGSSAGSLPNSTNIFAASIEAIKHGWSEYIQQPVLPASLAYVLLYFNVVLAPGSLMTAFLTHRGLNPSIIGGFSGLCALMGVAATFVSTKMVERLGILKAGAAGLIFQASLLTIAVAAYLSASLSQKAPVVFFLCLIVLSRLGHMSYNVVGAQILQTGIPASKVNLIGTTELAVASLAESVMLGVAIIANDSSHFGFLAILSLLSVVGAAFLYCRWLESPTDTQRSLFAL